MGSGQGDVQYHELGFLEVYVWTMKEGIRRYGRSINVFGHMIVGRSMVLINFCAIFAISRIIFNLGLAHYGSQPFDS